MNTYREPGERDERPDNIPLHVGSREQCPFCATSLVTQSSDGKVKMWANSESRPRFCGPGARLRLGWFRQRCKMWGNHLHQRCACCGATWICRCHDLVD